jgi:hypothetical protein
MPVDVRASPQIADLDLALVTIARIVRDGDPRRLEGQDLKQRIVGGIVNLECLLARLRLAVPVNPGPISGGY